MAREFRPPATSRAPAPATIGALHSRASLLACLAFAACTASVPLQSTWVTDDAIVVDATGQRHSGLTVTAGMQPLHVELTVTATAGSATWTILDPAGAVRWRAHVDGPARLQQECTLPAEPGEWQVRRDWQAFHGDQHFAVTGKGAGEIQVRVEPARR